MKYEAILFFLIPFIIVLLIGVVDHVELHHGDFFVHKNLALGQYYPKTLHLLSQQLGIPWELINAISVGVFYLGAFLLFGRTSALGIAFLSRVGYMTLFSGLAPTLLSIGVLFISLRFHKSGYSLINGLIQRGVFVISAFLMDGSSRLVWVFRILVIVLSLPYLQSFIGYLHLPTEITLFSFLDFGVVVLLILWGLFTYLGEETKDNKKFALLTMAMLIVAPFSYESRLFFLVPIFGASYAVKGLNKFGRFALPVGVMIAVFTIGIEVFKWSVA